MNKRIFKKLLSGLICLVLIAVSSLMLSACDKKEPLPQSIEQTAVTEIGKGGKSFDFKVTDKDGTVTAFKVNTDKSVVGDALEDVNLIEGDDGQYGLYVKKVNGILADYDIDGTYWAFYIDGAYASTGIDKTNIELGKLYEMRVSK